MIFFLSVCRGLSADMYIDVYIYFANAFKCMSDRFYGRIIGENDSLFSALILFICAIRNASS